MGLGELYSASCRNCGANYAGLRHGSSLLNPEGGFNYLAPCLKCGRVVELRGLSPPKLCPSCGSRLRPFKGSKRRFYYDEGSGRIGKYYGLSKARRICPSCGSRSLILRYEGHWD